MIPYFEQPHLHLFGPVTLHAFGALVAAAVLIGQQILLKRCPKKGLEAAVMDDLFFYAVGFGFVGAHWYAMLAYEPRAVLDNPLVLLKFWEGISSFGGIAGGIFGVWFFFYRRGESLPVSLRIRYFDALAYTFPFGWFFGRLGCAVAHDHPGRLTDFFLGISLKSAEAQAYITRVFFSNGHALPPPERLSTMAFHDLGLYEFLYTALVWIPAFLWLDRKERPPGFFLVAFALVYVPVRFALDFLRVADVRYGGLTPGQYLALAGLPAAAVVARRIVWPKEAAPANPTPPPLSP